MKNAKDSFFFGRMEEKGFYMLLLLSAAVIAAAAYILFAQPQEQPETASYQTEQSVTTSDEVTSVPKQPEHTQTDSADEPEEKNEQPEQPQEAAQSAAPSEADTQTTEQQDTEIQTIESMTFVKPTEQGEVCHAYTNDLEYNESTQDWRTHNGADYSGKAGDAVFAAADGIVTAVGKDALWGEYIVLSHAQDITSKYCGVAEIDVTEGDNVKGGTQIAVIGENIPIEEKEGAHLHLEIQQDVEYLNPEEVFG